MCLFFLVFITNILINVDHGVAVPLRGHGAAHQGTRPLLVLNVEFEQVNAHAAGIEPAHQIQRSVVPVQAHLVAVAGSRNGPYSLTNGQ